MKTFLHQFLKIFFLFLAGMFILKATAQPPDPDALYRFDDVAGTQVSDASGNGYHAFWYNYKGEDPGTALRTGWRPEEGYRNGAGYFAGDHHWCVNSCSSGSDVIIFANSERTDCDNNIQAVGNIFQEDLSSFTLSFWYKNDWNYLCEEEDPVHACAENEGDCAWERQVLFTMGWEKTGLTLEVFAGETYPTLVRITAAGGDIEKRVTLNAFYEPIHEKKWVHYAIVFTGDTVNNTGNLKLYLDGTITAGTNKNTEFGKILGDKSLVTFGAQAGFSVTDFDIGGECWGSVYEQCGITAEQVGRLRYGWLARGWIDDFAFWKDKSLSLEEIQAYDEILGGGVNTPYHAYNSFQIIPSVVSDGFRISNIPIDKFNVTIYNTIGQKLQTIHSVDSNQEIYLSQGIGKGMYFVGVEKDGNHYGVKKIIINK